MERDGGKAYVLKCPACGAAIGSPTDRCASCARAFGDDLRRRIEVFFELRAAHDHMRAVELSLSSGLEFLNKKIEKYESLLNEDLARASVPAREVEAPSIPVPAAEESPEDLFSEEEAAAAVEPAVTAPAEKATPKSPAATDMSGPSSFELRLGQKWILVVGIVTMVFGVAYFLKYSFDRGWVGPAGRVALAYVWGTAFLVGGNVLSKGRLRTFGLYIMGGGVAVLYFATFAAFQIYRLVPQSVAFFLMVIITTLACFLSLLHDKKWLALLGLVGGFLTPVLLSTGRDNQIALMTYMTILNLGLLGIAFRKRWDLLNYFGFAFTYLLYTAWHFSHYEMHKFWPAVLFLNVFYLIYGIIPLAYHFLRKPPEGRPTGFLIIIPNSLIAFGYAFYMIKEKFSIEWVGVVSVAYAAMFLAMASYIYRREGVDNVPFVVLLAKAALFLAVTVPIIFSKHMITIFWAAQAVTVLWAGAKIGRRSIIYAAHTLLLLSVMKFVLYDYDAVFGFTLHGLHFHPPYTALLVQRFITTAFVLGAVYVQAGIARRYMLRSIAPAATDDGGVLAGLLGALLFIALNVEVSSFFYQYAPPARFASVSVLWAVFSVVMIVQGFRAQSTLLRRASLVLFAITLLKVFLVDMSNVSTPYRIVSFVVLGLILIATSYLYHKHKDRIVSAIGEKETGME